MQRALSQIVIVLAAIGAFAAVSHLVSGSMAVATQPTEQPSDQPTEQPQQPGGAGMGQILINSLKTVDGCLGVDAGQMSSGKNSIFAWFEDAEAARRWYYHPTHRAMLAMAGGAADDDSKPLAHVEEGVPLMVIASLTFSDRPQIEGIPIPISQISIEVYQAAPGGAYINGKLAPESFEVEHMKNLSASAEE